MEMKTYPSSQLSILILLINHRKNNEDKSNFMYETDFHITYISRNA